MWTVKQANRAARFFGVAMVVVMVAAAVGGVLRREWRRRCRPLWLAMVVVAFMVRKQRGGEILRTAGRAGPR